MKRSILVGLIADTHIPYRRRLLPPQVFSILAGVDLILHAGDINVPTVLDKLRTIAPVEAVAGNGDDNLSEVLGTEKALSLAGFTIALTHGHLGKGKTTPDRAYNACAGADIIVFGHSHIPLIEWRGSTLLVNPGSPTDKRTQTHFSVGLLYLGETAVAEIIRFD